MWAERAHHLRRGRHANGDRTATGTDLPPCNGTTPERDFAGEANQARHAGKRNRRQQITPELREVDVEVGRGKTVAEAVKKIGVTE